MNFEALVKSAIEREASDILLSPSGPAALRIDGQLVLEGPLLSDDQPRRVLEQLLKPAQLEVFAISKTCDFALMTQGRRLRGSAYWSGGHVGLAFRLLPQSIATPEMLGLPAVLSQLMHRPQGLIVFTGATGQGKTTTQASLIDMLNREGPRFIVTLEDPIEYLHTSQKAIVDQRELGTDISGFGQALKHIVRQRPDVVMIGELRDEESIRSTLTLAGTGHLILSTLHTSDAVLAISRLVDGMPGAEQPMVRSQVASALLAVVSQRLVRGIHGKLVMAAEVLVNTPGVSALIREGHAEQIYGLMETEQQAGSQTLNHALEKLVKAERVAPREAERYLSMRESRPVLPKARAK